MKNDLAGHNNVNEQSLMNSSNYGAFDGGGGGGHSDSSQFTSSSSFPVMSKLFSSHQESANSTATTSTDLTRIGMSFKIFEATTFLMLISL